MRMEKYKTLDFRIPIESEDYNDANRTMSEFQDRLRHQRREPRHLLGCGGLTRDHQHDRSGGVHVGWLPIAGSALGLSDPPALGGWRGRLALRRALLRGIGGHDPALRRRISFAARGLPSAGWISRRLAFHYRR